MAKNDRFIVLSLGDDEAAPGGRDITDARPRSNDDFLSRPAGGRGERPARGGKVKVEVKKLGGEEKKAIEASPRRFAARPMPIRLIKPMRSKKKVTKSADAVQCGAPAVGADRSNRTGKGVVVAVLDTGIAKDHRTHPAFKDVEIVLRNFTGEAAHDTDGHGTHCAGTIFGRDV